LVGATLCPVERLSLVVGERLEYAESRLGRAELLARVVALDAPVHTSLPDGEQCDGRHQ
jgi:hypothetical protein